MRRVTAGLIAACLALSACGGGDAVDTEAGDADVVSEPAEDAGGADQPTDVGALLAVLEPGVDVADEPADPGAAEFRTGEDGESLVVADVVRTDASGFAEVAWFDGALARVDAGSTYRLVTLDTTPGEAEVVAELDTGRVWNRLRDGTGATYEVRTDVATAAIRGTAFWVACAVAGGCTFAVLEGTVLVSTADGTELELAAGDEVTVGEDGSPEGVVPTDPDAAWVARNAPLDESQGFAGLAASGEPTTDEPVRGYFEAFGARDEDERAQMLQFAVPGSAAHDFGVFWSGVARLGATAFSQEITIGDGVVEACIPEEQATAADEGCVTYRDIELDAASGLLVDFTGGDRRLSDTVVVGDGQVVQAEGASIEVVAARYDSRNDQLSVLWSTTNDGAAELDLDARLLAPSGAIVTHSGFTDRPIPPGSSVLNGINFAVDRVAGTLQVRLPSGSVLEVAIPAP